MVSTERFEQEAAQVQAAVASAGLRLGAPLTWVEQTMSTNDDALKGALAAAPHGALYVAEAQRQGRGRGGNSWQSAPGKHLTFSLLLRELPPVECLPLLTLVVGLATRDAVVARTALSPLLKWPNDVQIDGRKVAGILVESRVLAQKVEFVVVGVGLDVNGQQWSQELGARAITLEQATGSVVDRAALLVSFLSALERRIAAMQTRAGLLPQLDEWREVDALRGRRLRVGEVVGTGAGLDNEGALLVATQAGVRRVIAGTIVLLQ
jgi:BirA family biotin operon repressor/biotin-[acetyl-CoA-carboxylase] ligase